MHFSHIHYCHPEDISDQEVNRLRRLAFSAAVEVQRLWQQSPPSGKTQLDRIEEILREAGVSERSAHRYAVAQAAQFLSQEESFFESPINQFRSDRMDDSTPEGCGKGGP